MLRLLFLLCVLGVVYVMWDRGAFGNPPHHRTESIDGERASTKGPAETVGAAVDRGLAQAGRAVQRAGENLEHAADGQHIATPRPTP